MGSNYQQQGPWVSGSVPAINAGHLNALEAGIIAANNLAVSITPAMSQTAIQSVLNGLSSFTRVTFTGTFNWTGPVTVPFDGMHIDALNASFNQTVWGVPVFDGVGRNGVTYDIGQATFTGTRPTPGVAAGQAASATTLYRGSAPYCSTAAVWINGDYNFVRYCKTSYMPVGVFLSSWAGSTPVDHTGIGNRIGTLESDHANWGLLYVCQQDPTIDNLYVHDDLDDSAGANPTHAIYCSAATSNRASGGQFGRLRARNILNGSPYEIKYHDGLSIDSMYANNCKGILGVIDSNDLTVGRGVSLNTLFNDNQGALSFTSTNAFSQRPKLGPFYIQQAANVDERVVNILADYGDFDRLVVDSNHSSGVGPTTVGEILVRGTGNRFRRPTIRSLGAGSVPGIWVGYGAVAVGTIVERASVSGTLNVAKVDSGSTGVVVDFDWAAQSFTGAVAVDLSGGNSAAMSAAPSMGFSTLGDNPLLASQASAALSGVANAALQVRVTPKRNITVTSFTWFSVAASGNYDVAIVDDVTNAVLWSKGSTAWPAAGAVTLTVPSAVLVAGRTYRIAFAADNATGTLRMASIPLAGMDVRLDGTLTLSTLSSVTLPIGGTLTAGTYGATARIPYIVLQGS